MKQSKSIHIRIVGNTKRRGSRSTTQVDSNPVIPFQNPTILSCPPNPKSKSHHDSCLVPLNPSVIITIIKLHKSIKKTRSSRKQTEKQQTFIKQKGNIREKERKKKNKPKYTSIPIQLQSRSPSDRPCPAVRYSSLSYFT